MAKKWKLGMGWVSDSDIAEIPNYTTTVEDLICSVVLDVIRQKTNESEMNDAFVKSGMKEDGINIIPRKLLAKIAVIPSEYDRTFVSKILDDLSDINYHKAVRYLRPIFDKFSKPMEENRNILMEQVDHFLGGDLLEEESTKPDFDDLDKRLRKSMSKTEARTGLEFTIEKIDAKQGAKLGAIIPNTDGRETVYYSIKPEEGEIPEFGKSNDNQDAILETVRPTTGGEFISWWRPTKDGKYLIVGFSTKKSDRER